MKYAFSIFRICSLRPRKNKFSDSLSSLTVKFNMNVKIFVLVFNKHFKMY